VSCMERIVNNFRCIAKGIDTTSIEKEWIENLSLEMWRINSYMQSTVRRELQQMQFNFGNISNQKLEEVRALLAGEEGKNCLDDSISTYI